MKKKGLGITIGIVGIFLGANHLSVEATTLDFNQDLKGYDATIKTENNKNVLYTKKGKWELSSNSKIFSSKNLVINLDNTKPVEIDSIYTKCNLEFRGKGTLTAETADQFGINVGKYLKFFKDTKKGTGTVIAKGNTIGVRVENEIQSEGGTLEGYGADYGVWTNNDIKPYNNSTLKGVATGTNGVGIWAYRDIYAWKGATVIGEGSISGAQSEIAHIQAEDRGSSIKGVTTDINRGTSALYAKNKILRAYKGAEIIEEYKNSGLVISNTQAVNLTSRYPLITRSISDMNNYSWESIPSGVINTLDGLIGNPEEPFRTGSVEGVRNSMTRCSSNVENPELKTGGLHRIIFTDVTTNYTLPVNLKMHVNLQKDGSYEYTFEKTVRVDLDDYLRISDYIYNFNFTESSEPRIDIDSDFVVNNPQENYQVNYYYDDVDLQDYTPFVPGDEWVASK